MNSARVLLLSRWGLMRRLADIVIASTLLFLSLPLMAGVALAITFEKAGPVFEKEQRFWRGRRVTLLKFRTNVHDPENLTPKWLQETTPLGSFLRDTQIHLLPRLINVLLGDISLSGDGFSRNVFRD